MNSSPTGMSPAMNVEEEQGNTTGNSEAGGDKPDKLRLQVELNLSLGRKTCCTDKNTNCKLTCRCLAVLDGNEMFCQAVAEYQLMFKNLKPAAEQKKIVIEWMRSNRDEERRRLYRIPFILHEDDDHLLYTNLRNQLICANAMMGLLGRGYKWWLDCTHHHRNMTIPQHKLTGKVSNNKRKFDDDFADDLHDHFVKLQSESEIISTRWVREATGQLSLRDHDEMALRLPPYYSRRSCYASFCLEKRGMKITTSNTGNVVATPLDESQVKTIPSWRAYCLFWQTHYPKLSVRQPAEDICNFCYQFQNRHKFREEAKDEESSDEDEEEGRHDKTKNAPTKDSGAFSTPLVSVGDETHDMEQAILEAAEHVQMARSMREYVNEKILIARQDRHNNQLHADRTYTFVADYCQNMALPHFGNQQPGEVYYLTPCKLEGFGVADVSYVAENGVQADHLYFHVYKEGDGTKGGNNVASLIMKTLRNIGVLLEDSNGNPVSGKELNIIMDNCGGQNKNNNVLLLSPYLVELGFFKNVNMIFLVVGHTKNICDRRFNNLKQTYHKTQVYTFDQAVEVLGRSPHVTIWPVNCQQDWFDYSDMLQKPYKRLDKAKLSIKKNHIFSARVGTTINHLFFATRRSALPEHLEVGGDIMNRLFVEGNNNRLDSLKSLKPKRLLYPGLPGYKQILLYKSYIRYVPKQYHSDPLYKKPTKDVLEAEEADQKKRKASKREKKKKEITICC